MKLEERDKKTLVIGGIIAAVIVLYAFVFSPLMADLSRKRDAIPKKEKDLAEMKVLKSEYQSIQQQLQAAQAAAAKRGPLLTEIENITKQTNLSGKIVSLKPQAGVQTAGFRENTVEVRLENVALYDIVNYVFQLEQGTLRIRKLQFKPRYDNPKLLNATLLVSSAESS
ncbi:MAG TPA: type II secretion system protein GspM [Nitrospirota bacterium]|nr:type II secretion system protein GspM [Nitrospirota bacterium]